MPAARAPHRRQGASLQLAPRELDLGLDEAVLAALEEGVIVIDREARLLRANAAASALLGLDLSALGPGEPWWEPLAARLAGGGPLAVGGEVLRTGREARGVEVEIDRDGACVSLSVNYLPLRRGGGPAAGLVLSFRDVTVQKRERREQLDTQERLREAHDVAGLASWEWRPASGEVVVFHALAESDMAVDSVITFDQWLELVPPEQRDGVFADFEDFMHRGRSDATREFRYELPGGAIWLEIRSRAVRDEQGRLRCVRGTAQDITAQERARRALSETLELLQATLDSLPAQVVVLGETGEIQMTNRAWCESARARGADPASVGVGADYLAACDRAGEEPVAVEVAAGIRAIAAGTESSFAVEYPCFGPDGESWYLVSGLRYEGSGPVRVVITHEDITRRRAEEALVAADLEKLAWVGRIEQALTEERLVLHAQPILELASGRIVQRELLIRMQPDEGDPQEVIGPGSFLPIAEEFGLITEIDRWVIDRSAELAAAGEPVELNISARSIGEPRLLDHIEAAIARTGADPNSMVFEITETALVEDLVSARVFVERLHALGCRVALDDFGTGYGGFTHLKRLPIDYLKIDTEFVTDLAVNPDSRTVIRAIVRLARGFGLKTVAEGVEDEPTMALLRELEVDYAQGNHIARPAPLAG